jgi:membrane fusion protein, multidrug efflux system
MLFVAAASFGCNPRFMVEKPALPPPPVTVAKPIQKEIIEWDEYTGRTAARQSVEVRPRVSGYINRIEFKEGAILKEGDPLFVIDQRPYQAILNEAKASLSSAEAKRQLQLSDFARAEKLFQNHVTSKEDFDTSLAQKNTAVAQYYQAEAQLYSAQLNFDFSEIKAPINGRVGRELVSQGNLVQTDSTVLTKIVSIDPIYAYFNVDERTVQRYVNQIKSGELRNARTSEIEAYLQLESEEGFPHEGVIDFINNTYDSSTATLQVRAEFHNPDAYLMPDAFVRVRVPSTPRHSALLISDHAVGTDQDQKFVYVVDSDNVAEVRRVELGPISEGLRVVRAGIGPDDQVMISGLMNVRAGQKVLPRLGQMDQFLSPEDAPDLRLSEELRPAGSSQANPGVGRVSNAESKLETINHLGNQ